MIAGKMRSKIELLEPRRTTDRMGAEVTTYSSVRTVHAERVQMSGGRSEEAGEHFPDYSTQFNIRANHPVQENWRVRQLGGYLYAVTAIVPNIIKGYVTLICDRVNE